MALIKCPDCGKEISDKSGKCIHCGCPIPNPDVKEIKPKEEKIEKTEKEYVVGYRADNPGGIFALYIISLIFGIMIVIANSFLFIILEFLPFFIYLIILFYIIGTISILSGIWFIVVVIINRRNIHDCIVYNPKDKTLHLFPLYKKEIIISPNDYIELKDNFNTNNILIFTYDSHDGYKTRTSLGFCSNRKELRDRMKIVIDDCNNN